MTSLSDKISQLESQLNTLSTTPGASSSSSSDGGSSTFSKVKNLPWRIIIGIFSPILIFMYLHFGQPKLVQKKEGLKTVRSTPKVLIWTLVFSSMVWGSIYAYNRYFGGKML